MPGGAEFSSQFGGQNNSEWIIFYHIAFELSSLALATSIALARLARHPASFCCGMKRF